MHTGKHVNLTGHLADTSGSGCGLPTAFARIKPGDVVVDLGAGAGTDCWLARTETGETGRVIGIDTDPALIEQARQNADKLGYTNVQFVQGDIDAIALASGLADVVISNCATNRVVDRQQFFDEAYRILKMGGRLSVSDIVLVRPLPDELQQTATNVANVTGAIQEQTYLDMIVMAGFEQVAVQQRQPVHLHKGETADASASTKPTDGESAGMEEENTSIACVTIYAEKPAGELPDLSNADWTHPENSEPDEDDLGDLKGYDFLGRL